MRIWYNTHMGRNYELLIEKTERVYVVVKAANERLAHAIALEAERRGEITSAEDVFAHVVSCKCCG